MNHTKFCKDCKHARRDIPFFLSNNLKRCAAPQEGLNPITGKPILGWAEVNREFDSLCGSDAKWFEPK